MIIPPVPSQFQSQYDTLQKHLVLKGLRPKTVKAYSRAMRRVGAWFDYQLDDLSEAQLLDYFYALLAEYSWSTVKHDIYGLSFYYRHVLKKPWVELDLVKPPKVQRLPDIATPDEVARLIRSTRVLSYRVFYFTLYSLGLRLGEGQRLQVNDIDAGRRRIHVHNSKGNKDRLVPLPAATLTILRSFWRYHRNPVLLFPNRHDGVRGAAYATTPLDRGGIQKTLRQVCADCRVKKTSHPTAYATAMPLI